MLNCELEVVAVLPTFWPKIPYPMMYPAGNTEIPTFKDNRRHLKSEVFLIRYSYDATGLN